MSDDLVDEDELSSTSFEHHTIGKNAQPKNSESSPTLYTRAAEPHSSKPSASISPIPDILSSRHGTPQPTREGLAPDEVVSSPSSSTGKDKPNSKVGTPQKDGPGLLGESGKAQEAVHAIITADDKSYDERDRTAEVGDNRLNTSWLTRFKSCLSFNFGTTVAPNQVMNFSGQPEATQDDDDETTTRALAHDGPS